MHSFGPQLKNCPKYSQEKKSTEREIGNIPQLDFLSVSSEDKVTFPTCQSLGAAPEQISGGFHPKNVEKAIHFLNCGSSFANLVTICQLNHTLNWKDVISKVQTETIKEMLMDKEFTRRLQEEIPYETLAKLMQLKREFASFITRDSLMYKHTRCLLKNRNFMKLLPKEFIAELMFKPKYRHFGGLITHLYTVFFAPT